MGAALNYVIAWIDFSLLAICAGALLGAYYGKKDDSFKFDDTDYLMLGMILLYGLTQIGNIYYLLK